MDDDRKSFEAFMRRRAEAASAYVCGDAGPLRQLVAQTGEATFYAPRGGAVHGADAVLATYERDVAAFDSGGASRFEILQMDARDGLAYWVGFQNASARMRGRAEPMEFNLRVTEVFRREGDDWKLVHRHADAQAEEQSQ